MKFELKIKRKGEKSLWVYKTRVLTGKSSRNADSFAKAVGLSFGRHLSRSQRQSLAKEFCALESCFFQKEGYRLSNVSGVSAKICSVLRVNGLRVFSMDGDELWCTYDCPTNNSRAVLVQLRKPLEKTKHCLRSRTVELTTTASGRWVKTQNSNRGVQGLRVATTHSESYLSCLACGIEMMNWAELLSHVETFVRFFELERTDPAWRMDFWASELKKPNLRCGPSTPDALEQRKACAEMAMQKLKANEQWEYTEQSLYATRLSQWSEMLAVEEIAFGWDTETATASGESSKPEGPETEALAFEAAEALNTSEAYNSLCRTLVPVCVQISGRGVRAKKALERAALVTGKCESATWDIWDSTGDHGIPEDVTVLTAVIDPAETVDCFEEIAEGDGASWLLSDTLGVIDRIFFAVAAGKCMRMVLFAHNGARFDNVLMLRALRKVRGPNQYRAQFFRGAIQRISYFPGPACGYQDCRRCEIVFCDTCLVFPASLAQLSKELDLSGGGKLDLDARKCADVWVTRTAWEASDDLVAGASGDVLRSCLLRYPERFPKRGPEPERDVFYHILVYAIRDAVAVLELAEKQMTYLNSILNEVRTARGPKVGDESESIKIPLGGINTISGFSYICTSAMLFPDPIIIPQGARAADINACMIGGHTEIHAQGFLLHNEGPMLGKGPLRQLDIDGMYCNIQRAKIFPAGKPQAVTKAVADSINVWLASASRDDTPEDSPHGMVFGTFEVKLPRDEREWPAVGVLGVKMRVEYEGGESINNQAWTNIPRRQRMTLLHALTFIRRGFQVRLVSSDGVSWGTHFPEGLCAPFLAGMNLYLAGKARSKKEGQKAMTMVYKLVANANFGQMAMQSTRPNMFEIAEEDYREKVEKRELRGDFELLDVTEVASGMLLVRTRPRIIMHSRPHQWGTMILAGAHSEFSDFAARFDPLLGFVPPRDRPQAITHGDTDSVFVPESLALGCVGPDWWVTNKGKPQIGGSSKLSVTLDEKEPFGKGFHVIISKKKENILLNSLGEKEFVVAKGMALKTLQPKHFQDVWGKTGKSESVSRTTLKKTLTDALITETVLSRKMRLIPVIMGEKRLSRKLKPRNFKDPRASKLSKTAPLLYTDLTSLLDLVRGFRPGYVLRRVVFFNAQPLDFDDEGDFFGTRSPQFTCCDHATDLVEIRWPRKLRPYFPGTAEANYRLDLDRMQEARATMMVCRNNICRGNRRPHHPRALADA